MKECGELLDYCPVTGLLTWREYRNSQAVKGQEAGHISAAEGYLVVGVDNKVFQAHRLAWFHYYGHWPADQLDHVNHIRTNNRISNLQAATHTQNMRNKSKSKANTTGHTGVYNTRPGKWMARICVNRKQINLGTFCSQEDAVNARKAAEAEYQYHLNHGL